MPLDDLFALFPPATTTLSNALRTFIMEKFPDLTETVDLPSRILAFSIAGGMRGVVFTIIPSRKGVKLGIPYGSRLEDPAQLLSGNGKLHKVIEFQSTEMLEDIEFLHLVDESYLFSLARL